MSDDWDLDVVGVMRDAVTGMAFIGLDGRLRSANPAFCRILGRSEDELVGISSEAVTHPADRALSANTLGSMLSGERSSDQIKKRYVRPDGSVVVVVRTSTLVRDRSGRPVGLFTQVVDVTDAESAQRQAARSEARLQALLAEATDMTVLIDADGKLTYVSPACRRLLGYSPAELCSLSAFEFIHPDDADRARSGLVARIRDGGRGEGSEFRVVHRDGTWRHAEITVTNLLTDPAVGALVVNLRDVTEQKRYEEQLRSSEQRFRALVANSWDIITVHDANGNYLYCSPAITPQLGYRPEELIGANPFSLIHPDDLNAADFQQVVERNQNGTVIQYRFSHRDGSWRWVESVVHNRLDDPAVGGVIVTTRNVTRRRRRDAQQAAIAELSNRILAGGPLEDLMEHAVGVVGAVLGVEHCTVVREEGNGRLLVLARSGPALVEDRFAAESDGQPRTLSAQALRDGRTVVWIDEPGQPRPEALQALGTLRSGAAAVISPASGARCSLSVYSERPGAFAHDDIAFLESVANVLASAITRHRMELELRRQALHDHLTGLPNRTLLIDRLHSALARLGRRPSSVAVLFVDLDDFKMVNDSLGHSAGDVVVAAVATRVRRAVRASDTVARFGGDELVVVSEDTDEEAAGGLAQRLRVALAAPVEVGARLVTVTASVGYAVTSDPEATADDILAEADAAMYAAKQAGKDRGVAFAAHMRAAASAHLDAVSGIRRALEHGEFRLHYQPIVNLLDGSTVGCEALLRWEHPDDGLLGPDSVIPYAEESGLIVPIGDWVLRQACGQSAAWRAAGRPAAVSVNVSPRQLLESDIVSTVGQALADSGTEPGDLSLELTENAIMSDLGRATGVIEGLRALGVQVGMDDFGTGYSSLSQLARLPLDFLKIDRSFIANFDGDRRSAALLRTVATLSEALGLHAIAEGVERVDQLDYLTGIGINLVQGFLFSGPVPPERLPA